MAVPEPATDALGKMAVSLFRFLPPVSATLYSVVIQLITSVLLQMADQREIIKSMESIKVI